MSFDPIKKRLKARCPGCWRKGQLELTISPSFGGYVNGKTIINVSYKANCVRCNYSFEGDK